MNCLQSLDCFHLKLQSLLVHKFEVKTAMSLGNQVNELWEVIETCVVRNVYAILMLLLIASSDIQTGGHNFSVH